MRFVVKVHVDSHESGPPGHEDYTPAHDEERVVDSILTAARGNPISVVTFPGGEPVPLYIIKDVKLASDVQSRRSWVERYKKQYEDELAKLEKQEEAARRVERYKIETKYFD